MNSPLLKMSSVNRAFGGIKVAQDITMSLEAGDRVGLIGPNGAGKTTLVNLLTGALSVDSGAIEFSGSDIVGLNEQARVKAGLVRTFQVNRPFRGMNVQEHVSLAILERMKKTSAMLSRASGLTEVNAKATEVMRTLNIEYLAPEKVENIAYGQQRLLDLAIALALSPKVLLLDEPAAGLSRVETSVMFNAVNQLPTNLAILMIEHDMDLVFRFAQRLLVLVGGKIVFSGTPKEVASNPEVKRLYLGSHESSAV